MLPYHKRQPKRLLLFGWPFAQLTTIFTAYKLWRADVFYRLNVNGQLISLETYLNRYIVGANGDIVIKSFEDWGAWVQLLSEPGETYALRLSLVSEDEGVFVAMNGEITPENDVDFYVVVPASVAAADVARVVNQYKLAGKRYKVIND
jgi:sulfur carrier protein ThiS